MLLVDQVFHAWMKAGQLMLTPVSYVDNWELVLSRPEFAQRALQHAMDFASQWDLKLDVGKTYAWGSNTATRASLRTQGLLVRHDAKDLGAHLVYTKQLREFFPSSAD